MSYYRRLYSDQSFGRSKLVQRRCIDPEEAEANQQGRLRQPQRRINLEDSVVSPKWKTFSINPTGDHRLQHAGSGVAISIKLQIFNEAQTREKKGGEPDFYWENGLMVFTKTYHLRGICCQSGCRHCPYGFLGKKSWVFKRSWKLNPKKMGDLPFRRSELIPPFQASSSSMIRTKARPSAQGSALWLGTPTKSTLKGCIH